MVSCNLIPKKNISKLFLSQNIGVYIYYLIFKKKKFQGRPRPKRWAVLLINNNSLLFWRYNQYNFIIHSPVGTPKLRSHILLSAITKLIIKYRQ